MKSKMIFSLAAIVAEAAFGMSARWTATRFDSSGAEIKFLLPSNKTQVVSILEWTCVFEPASQHPLKKFDLRSVKCTTPKGQYLRVDLYCDGHEHEFGLGNASAATNIKVECVP